MLDKLFLTIDRKDTAGFTAFFTEEGVFRFGNMPAQRGPEAIALFVSGFFQSVDTLAHRVDESWEVPGGVVCHGEVTYTRKDGSKLTVPFANILIFGNSGIVQYHVFADVSTL